MDHFGSTVKPYFRYTRQVRGNITVDLFCEGDFSFQAANDTNRFPIFEVFRHDLGLSVRVHSTYLRAQILEGLSSQNPRAVQPRYGRVANGHSYWQNEEAVLNTAGRSHRMRPAKWPETTFTDVFSPLKLGGDSSQALVQCSDGSGSSSCQFGSNWPFETPPTERDDEVFLPGFSPESQTTTPKIVGDYLDINFDDLRRVRPFLWQLWEQAEACHQDSTYQGFKPDGHGQLYHYDPRELKLFVANFLEDSSLFDVSDSIFGYPQDDAYSSWGWTDMQNVIRRNRISRMCQLFEGDSEEDLDRSDAYMDFILHPAEPMSSSEWSNISQSSTLSQDELETMVKSIRQPSYLEEMWGFGVSFPAEPDLKSLKNFDIHAEVKHHRTLLFTCDSHLLNTHCDSTSRLRNQCAQEHVLSYIDTEISRRLQRKLLQRNVRRALAASCSKLAIGLPQLQSSVRLRALITDSLRVWKTGVNAIDQLLQNSALQVFHDTMCLILVADALRSVGVGTLPSQEPKPFCSSEEFFQDLTRWRPHIETCNFDNLSFFDECVRILWPGRQFPALMHPSEPQGNLDHFCMLLSNISSTDIVPETSNDSIPFVYASFPQGQRQGPAHLSRNRAQVIAQLCSDLKNPVPGSENLALYNSFWKDLQPSVVLLSGTIVFGTVLAFFLSLEHPDLMQDCTQTLRDWCLSSQFGWASTRSRNAWLIASLLKLSQFTVRDFAHSLQNFGSPQNSAGPSTLCSKPPFDQDSNRRAPRDGPSLNPPPPLVAYTGQVPSVDTSQRDSYRGTTSTNRSRSSVSSVQALSKIGLLSSTLSSPQSSVDGVRISCPHCPKTYQTRSARNKHIKERCKNALAQAPKLVRKMFECKWQCGYQAAVEYNVRKVHETNYCPRRLPKKSAVS